MDVSSRRILITGGSSGIGLAFAERFLAAGSEVIICGRREDKLREAQQKHPRLRTRVCDVEQESERESLAEWAVRELPDLDVLFNNAGIQRWFQFAREPDCAPIKQEIAINLEAPIHLTALLLPHLLDQTPSAIVNVTSGLSFVPLAAVPIYSATKAALHSFTLSLRHQLAKTQTDVIEIIPPAVNTDLGGPGLHATATPLDEFADVAFAALKRGDRQIAYGFSDNASRASREELDQIFARMNQPAG